MKSIVTVTVSPTIDVNTSIDFVVAERKLRCDTPLYEPGGGGINVSRAIVKLGGESTALHAAGGPTGKLLNQMLDAENISHVLFLVLLRERQLL